MIFFLSFFLSLVGVSVFAQVAKKLGVYDVPDGVLKTHSRLVPYFGGIGIFLALLPFLYDHSNLLILFSLIMILGLLDDVFSVSPKLRLLLELLVSFMLVYYFHSTPLFLVLFTIGAAALINAVNMMDGMDGICASNVSLSSFVFFLLSTNHFSSSLSLSVLGASLGYLVYNFPPAKVFMGDAGSYVLGLSLSTLYLSLSRSLNLMDITMYLYPLWIFFLDLISGFIRRIRNSRNPFEGDRDHIYDKIHRRVKNERKTLFLTLSLNAAFSSLAFLHRISWPASLTALFILTVYIIKALNLFDYDS